MSNMSPSPELHYRLIPNESTSHDAQANVIGVKREAQESPHVPEAGRVVLEGTPKH